MFGIPKMCLKMAYTTKLWRCFWINGDETVDSGKVF